MYQMRCLLLFSLLIISFGQTCHYSCLTCDGQDFYRCTQCNINRGKQPSFTPISGMCYCTSSSDQDQNGVCILDNSYNRSIKSLIASFIGLSLLFGLVMTIIKGHRYYLLKTIEDVQQLSLIVFINLYFPQQFDIFLSHLYRFNISSYTFASLTAGSLFQMSDTDLVASTGGENIYGKYKLLLKTANFFSNTFTWMIVLFSIMVFVGILWLAKFFYKKKIENSNFQNETESDRLAVQEHNQTQFNLGLQACKDQQKAKRRSIKKKKKTRKQLIKEAKRNSKPYRIVTYLRNIFFLTIPITFFYFSLIELNVNIFTQIGNLTFSSHFSAVGAFFSAVFLGLEIIILILLLLKTHQQVIKPQWMRDFTYSPCTYLIRTNFKTITKYFFFISCIKKILFALVITLIYENPVGSVVGLSAVEAIYLCIAIYCQPYERRYIRIHFYLTEGFKLFMFLSLLNFSQKYRQYLQLIDMTVILYAMLSLIFGFHLFWILLNFVFEWKVYWHLLKLRFILCFPQWNNEKRMKTIKNVNKLNKFGVKDEKQTQMNQSQVDESENKQKQSFQEKQKIQEKVIGVQDPNEEAAPSIPIPFQGYKIGYYCDGIMFVYEKTTDF